MRGWFRGRERATSQPDIDVVETIGRVGQLIAAELDLSSLVKAVIDAATLLSGATFGAFFYHVVDPNGVRSTLYALSGAPREAFDRLGMPRNTPLFGATFRGECVVRSADITLDPRFGKNAPFNGFPAGHWPVRSYLAVPVISRSGEAIGGLFFGHSTVGVFSEEAERAITVLAGHAAVAIDNAQLFKAREKVEAHQKLLLDELNHRVKNTLATVQSIAAQTLRLAPELPTFKRAFEARLIALSEAHNLLARGNWRGVDLQDLVHRELAPHGAEQNELIKVSGHSVWLAPKPAVAIGMALHELATNAARHGSLSAPGGRLEVSWTVTFADSERRLKLLWQESGGPPVIEPARRGFGSTLIERGLKHDLRGEAKLYFEPAGLRCVIDVALPAELVAA